MTIPAPNRRSKSHILWPLSEFNPTKTASKIIVTKSAITATNKMICPIAVFLGCSLLMLVQQHLKK